MMLILGIFMVVSLSAMVMLGVCIYKDNKRGEKTCDEFYDETNI